MNLRRPYRSHVGDKCITLRSLRNGYMRIPKGAAVTISSVQPAKNDGRFSIESDPCKHCGVQISISRVSHHDLGLLLESK